MDDVDRLAPADPVELQELLRPTNAITRALEARPSRATKFQRNASVLTLGRSDRRDVVREQGEPVAAGEVGGEQS